jgi:desulfoferrodoxin-like iron-binding protein
VDAGVFSSSKKTLYSVLHKLLYSQQKGGEAVGVQEINEKYRCKICGNEVVVTMVGGGTLVCCGEDMELIS